MLLNANAKNLIRYFPNHIYHKHYKSGRPEGREKGVAMPTDEARDVIAATENKKIGYVLMCILFIDICYRKGCQSIYNKSRSCVSNLEQNCPQYGLMQIHKIISASLTRVKKGQVAGPCLMETTNALQN